MQLVLAVIVILPLVLAARDFLDIKPKSDDDNEMGMSEEKRMKLGKSKILSNAKVSAQMNWVIVIKSFETTARAALSKTIIDTLLQSKGIINEKLLSNYLNSENRENFIKSVVVNVMSTPEYQLC